MDLNHPRLLVAENCIPVGSRQSPSRRKGRVRTCSICICAIMRRVDIRANPILRSVCTSALFAHYKGRPLGPPPPSNIEESLVSLNAALEFNLDHLPLRVE